MDDMDDGVPYIPKESISEEVLSLRVAENALLIVWWDWGKTVVTRDRFFRLLEQGYDVVGLFMKNWHDTSVTVSKECPWLEDSNDAMMVAQALGIPFSVIDLSEVYRQKVVDYMFSEYEKGRTPNPDVLCNREIKFDVFLKAAMELGADYVATGHYARIGTTEKGGRTIYLSLIHI